MLKNASSGVSRPSLWFSVRSLCLCGECFSASSHPRDTEDQKDRTEKSLARNALAIIFTLVCLMGTGALSQNKIPPQEAPLLTFDDLKRNDGIEGTFRIEGAYVLEIHKCPPCPPRAQCKPCLGDYVVVTDNLDEKDPLLIKRLRIFTGKLERFELKMKFSFTARVRGRVPKGKPIEELDLIDILLQY